MVDFVAHGERLGMREGRLHFRADGMVTWRVLEFNSCVFFSVDKAKTTGNRACPP